MLLLYNVNSIKTLISELILEEVEELKALQEECKDRNCEYEKQQLAVESLYTLIYKTISRFYYIYLLTKETLYNMIVALKLQIALTDRVWEIELTNQY